MIFSLFRNGKEQNPSCFRVETHEELATFAEMEIWARFIHRHYQCGGTIGYNEDAFIEEAKNMGYIIQPIDN